MKKKILTEATPDYSGIILGTAALGTLVYFLRDSIKKWFNIEDEPLRGERLFKDRDFVLDLKKIIIEEGGIYEFLDLIRPLIANGDWDANNFWSYKSISFAKNVAGKHIPRIIKKILDTPGFKKFAKKEGLKDKDFEAWGNGFYFVLTSYGFRKMLHQALVDVGDDAEFAYREMTDKEKRKFFSLDHKINLKSLLPNNITKGV